MDDNNPCRNCGTEYPHRTRTAADTPPEQVEMLALLAEVELHLKWARVFITTREKSHPCGVDLHDELLAKVTAAIEAA